MERQHIHVMDETSWNCKHILVPQDFLVFVNPTIVTFIRLILPAEIAPYDL